MSMRQTLTLAAALLLGCLTIGSFLGRPAAAEPKAEANAVGRYQIVSSTTSDLIVVLDTSTGKCWGAGYRTGVHEDAWQKFGTPAKSR